MKPETRPKPLWITRHSSTHAPMALQHFLPSFRKFGLDQAFDLLLVQEDFHAGEFGQNSFNEWGREVMGKNLALFKQNMGNVVVVSGCDIRFYADVSKDIFEATSRYEFTAIHDVFVRACGDLNAFRVGPRIIELFEWIIANDASFLNQQWTLNVGLDLLKLQVYSYGTDYWTVGMSNGGVVWKPGDPVLPPPTIKLHHGNFAVGAVDKMLLLNQCLGQTKRYRRGAGEAPAPA